MSSDWKSPVLGYFVFCGIKFFGYWAAAVLLKNLYSGVEKSSAWIGATRTLLGMLAGGLFWLLIGGESGASRTDSEVIFFGTLIFLRVIEWWLLIWFFFDRKFVYVRKDWLMVVLGVIWSFVLDIPAVLGLLMTGGFRIC